MIASDEFLKIDHFKKVMKMICQKKLSKIVIVGSSHSGFSCAWLLLNGPASFNKNNHLKYKTNKELPKGYIHENENCKNCAYKCICLGQNIEY